MIRSDVVPIGKLTPNPWNPNRMDKAMFRKELASIRRFGFVNPIIVRSVDGVYQIIDGEHRWKAAEQLGFTEVPITIVEGLDDDEAKQLTVVLNETRGRADPTRLGALLTDLLTSVPKSDLLDVLPIEPMAFDKLTGLADFDWSVFTPPDTASASWVERTYRIPKDAALVLDEALEAAKDGEGIEDWQALERIAADYLSGVTTSATPSPQPMARASSAASR